MQAAQGWLPSADDTTQLLVHGPYEVARQLHQLGKLTHPLRRQVREKRQLEFSVEGVRIVKDIWPHVKLTPAEEALWLRLQRMMLCMRLGRRGWIAQRRTTPHDRGFREGLPTELCRQICRLL